LIKLEKREISTSATSGAPFPRRARSRACRASARTGRS
jgi:hypothetical protein